MVGFDWLRTERRGVCCTPGVKSCRCGFSDSCLLGLLDTIWAYFGVTKSGLVVVRSLAPLVESGNCLSSGPLPSLGIFCADFEGLLFGSASCFLSFLLFRGVAPLFVP